MAKSYEDLGLNNKLQSVNSLANRPITNIYDLDAITANKSRIASLNSLSGGTLILGGTNSGDGVLNINAASGARFLSVNNGSIIIYGADSSANPQIIWDYNQQILYGQLLTLGGTNVGTLQGQLVIFDGASEMFRLDPLNGGFEISGTAAGYDPGALSSVLYLDTSAGKTRLMARFDTGVAQVVASEP